MLRLASSLFGGSAVNALASASQSGVNTIFTIDGSDSILLVDVAKSALTAANIRFG